MERPTPLDLVTDLTAFLMGETVDGITLNDPASIPHLTQAQADTVVWYLGNLYAAIPDHIERCDECGQLYDQHSEGRYFDHGHPPHAFCGCCLDTSEALAKAREGRRLEKARTR